MSLADRVAGKAGSAATFVFRPSAGGDVPVGGTITLNYPASFFLSSPSPNVTMSGGSTANCTSQTASSVVLTLQSGTVAASTAATVTLTGFTMGAPTANVVNSVDVVTSQVNHRR